MKTINLGGKDRKLSFDLNAMVAYEETTGKRVTSWKEGYIPNMKEMRVIIWACLISDNISDDESITLQEVGSWVTMENFHAVVDKVMGIVDDSLPVPRKAEGKN